MISFFSMGNTPSSRSKQLRAEEKQRKLNVDSYADLLNCVERANALVITQELGLKIEAYCRIQPTDSFLWRSLSPVTVLVASALRFFLSSAFSGFVSPSPRAFTDITLIQKTVDERGKIEQRSHLGQKAFLRLLWKLESHGSFDHGSGKQAEEGTRNAAEEESSGLVLEAKKETSDEEECAICLDAIPGDVHITRPYRHTCTSVYLVMSTLRPHDSSPLSSMT